MLAVSDFITQLAHLPYGYFAFTGTLVQRLDFCHIIMTPSLISMNFGTSLIWMIGLDRLLSVMYPAGYMQWQKVQYLLLTTSPGVIYCLFFIVLGWQTATDELMLCFIPEAYGLLAKNAWVGSTLLFNALVVVTYIFLLMVVRRNKENLAIRSHLHDARSHRLLKSLMIIMLFEFFGWFSNICILGTAIVVGASFKTIFYIEVYAGCLVNVSIACNFYLLYYNSTDYRNAFKNVLCFWRNGYILEAGGSSTSQNPENRTPVSTTLL
uniref:G-protein coupled receptors family 1 profile domain-containing protein n=1 Tax=Plectus sambesii TaxID=2011161 RepID=A0A914W7C8_9BILA